MFGVFAIDEILCYRGTRFPGSRILCHPAVKDELKPDVVSLKNIVEEAALVPKATEYIVDCDSD